MVWSGARMRAGLAGILSCSCLLAALAPAASAAVDPAAQTVGHKFVNEAYRRSRLSALPAALSAQEAEIALQFANQADPENAHTLKLLVEAAAATGDNDVRREALRNLIRLDPGDLVAQVQYIDFMASATQAIDERGKIYGGALSKKAFDAQVRSEMAVRLAGIAEERGDVEGARGLLK